MVPPLTADALDYWTLAIAIVGALTGLGALLAQVWTTLVAGPRVKVSVGNSLMTRERAWVLTIEATNIGRLPVTLLDSGVTFMAGGTLKRSPIGLMREALVDGPIGPHRLADGESVTWLLDPGPIAATIAPLGAANVRGYVRLATGPNVNSPRRRKRQVDVVRLAGLS